MLTVFIKQNILQQGENTKRIRVDNCPGDRRTPPQPCHRHGNRVHEQLSLLVRTIAFMKLQIPRVFSIYLSFSCFEKYRFLRLFGNFTKQIEYNTTTMI